MKDKDLNMKVFAVYLFTLGLTLACIPNVVLPLFGFEEVTDVWIRLLGLSFFLISLIYYIAIKDNWLSFYKLSIIARFTVCGFMIICVLLKLAPLTILIFGLIDVLGALWTLYALRHYTTQTSEQ